MGTSPEAVTLAPYNTVTLSNGVVYTLETKFCGAFYVNVYNLGPCTVYYRADADPAPGDPESATLPPGSADNGILLPDGETGLRFKAGPPCARGLGPPDCSGSPKGCVATISVRLVQS